MKSLLRTLFISLFLLFSINNVFSGSWGTSNSAPPKTKKVTHKDRIQNIIESSHYMNKFLLKEYCLKLDHDEKLQLSCLKAIKDRAIAKHLMWSCNKKYRNVGDSKIVKCLKRVGTPLKRIRKSLTYARSYLFGSYSAGRKGQSTKMKSHLKKGKYFLNGAITLFPKDGFNIARELLVKAQRVYLRYGNTYRAAWSVKNALKHFNVHLRKRVKRKVVKKSRKTRAQKRKVKKAPSHRNPKFCNGGDCWYQSRWVERGLKKRPAVWYWSEVVEFIYKDGRRYRLGLTPTAIKRLGNPVLDIDCESDYRRIGIDQRGRVIPGDHFTKNRMRFILNPDIIPVKRETIEEVDFNMDKGFIIPSHINIATSPVLCKWIRTGNRQFNREWKSLLTTFPTVFAFFGLKMGTSVVASYTKVVSRVATINRMISKNRGHYRNWVMKWNAKNPGNKFSRNLNRLGKQSKTTPLSKLSGRNARAARRYEGRLQKNGEKAQARRAKWENEIGTRPTRQIRKLSNNISKLEKGIKKLKKEAENYFAMAKRARNNGNSRMAEKFTKKANRAEASVSQKIKKIADLNSKIKRLGPAEARALAKADKKIAKWNSKADKLSADAKALRREAAAYKKLSKQVRSEGAIGQSEIYKKARKKLQAKARVKEMKAQRLRDKSRYAKPSKADRARYARTKEALYKACNNMSLRTGKGKRALAEFTKFTMVAKASLTFGAYLLIHMNEKKNAGWYTKLGWNTVLGFGLGWVSAQIVGRGPGGTIGKSMYSYVVGSSVDYVDTRFYQMIFGVSEDEAKRKIKKMMNDPNTRKEMRKLYVHMKKILKSRKYRELKRKYSLAKKNGKDLFFDMSDKERNSKIVLELFTEAYKASKYNEQAGMLRTGNLADDRFYFNMVWGTAMTVPNIMVYQMILKSICMGNRVGALAMYVGQKAFNTSLYFGGRKIVINQ